MDLKAYFRRNKEKKTPRKKGFFREYIELFCEVFVFVFFVNTFLLQSYAIPTPSMEKNMLVGDHLLLDKVSYSPAWGKLDRLFLPQVRIKRGMIAAFKSPAEIRAKNWAKLLYVKRIIGIPGDTIRMIDNQVFINGQAIEEPYVNLQEDVFVPNHFPPQNPQDWWPEFPQKFRHFLVDTPQGKAFKLPQDYYFCMGDNRNISSDSRIWGPVHKELIVGKPWRVYWSYEAEKEEYQVKGFYNKIKGIVNTIIHFIPRTRWQRTLKKYQ